jgi:endonuclease/exonuclease/phosphatase family metal-dependent hydrolase
MKLITLNTWAGRLKEPFEQFLQNHAQETDIFCFQEIFNQYTEETTNTYIKESDGNPNIFEEIATILVDFEAHFCPVAENTYGMAIFLKKEIEVIRSGEVVLYQSSNDDDTHDHDRKMQWMYVKKGTKDLMIMNVHGHWDPSGKNDTPNRIEQSNIINTFIESNPFAPKILVGDFNLDIHTKSIQLIEKYFINLVKEKGIATTRTEFYTGESRHADYVFVSPEVLVEHFNVLPDVVSDHTPLSIDFDLF